MVQLRKTAEVRSVELLPAAGSNTTYLLAGFGSLRVGGYFGGKGSTFRIGSTTWRCDSQGLFVRSLLARGSAGRTDGRFTTARLGRGNGTVEWKGREYTWRSAGRRKARYWLMDGDTMVCAFACRGAGAKPMMVAFPAAEDLPGALVMFAVAIAYELTKHRRGVTSSSGGSGDGGDGCGGGGDGGGSCGGGGCGGGGS